MKETITEEWVKLVAERNGINLMIDSNDGEDYWDADMESLMAFAEEVSAASIYLYAENQNDK